jgi:hypothetical protein
MQLNIKELEHLLIEKVGQLSRDMLCLMALIMDKNN